MLMRYFATSDCANIDHEKAVKVLVQGLHCNPQVHSGYLIHNLGAGILRLGNMQWKKFGETSSKIYDD